MGNRVGKMVRVRSGEYTGEIGKVIGERGNNLKIEFTSSQKEWVEETNLDIK